MRNQFRSICQKLTYVSRIRIVVSGIAAGLMLLAAGEASAFTTHSAIDAMNTDLRHQAAEAVIKAGYCPDGRAGCPDYEPEPQYAPPIGAGHWSQPQEPESNRASNAEPCEEKKYAAHVFEPYPARGSHYRKVAKPVYEEELKDWCGVRCWFRRLRSGYCGRGCDYYLFRLNAFPEGKLSVHHRRKLACR